MNTAPADADVVTFVCLVCGDEKPVTDFAIDKRSKRGHTPYCKTCRREWAKAYRASRPELSRRRDLGRYGLTIEDYDRMLAAQDGRCAICRTTEPGGNGRRMHVDHDHDTGKVRGLLCSPCNTGLARFKDSPDLMATAIAYLKEHGR